MKDASEILLTRKQNSFKCLRRKMYLYRPVFSGCTIGPVGNIFKTEEELAKQYIATHTNGEWQTSDERKAVEAIFASLKEKATSLDSTLAASAEAALKKMDYQLQVLEQKMLRAEKRQHETALQRQVKLKKALFPNGALQERYENFTEYYPLYGQQFIDVLKENTEPLRNEFLIISQ